MARRSRTAASDDRIAGDPFNAAIDGIGFVVHRHRPECWRVTGVANPRYDILAFALSGRASYECGGERFEVTRGTLLFFPRGVWHAGRTDPRDPWSFFSAGFRLLPGEPFAGLPVRVEMANAPAIRDDFEQLERQWLAREPGFAMACRARLLLLMQQYVAAAQREQRTLPHAEQLGRIVEDIHANVGRVAPVAELAEQAGLSDSRFRLLFRQLTGCSVTRYQNRLRIRVARDLLASGQYGVGEVAEELGFRDVYYFSRLFKRMTGMTPSACRGR